jgi:hypothetical protein
MGDEHGVQRTEFVYALLDYAFYFAHYGDIAYRYGGFPAEAGDLVGDFFGALFVGGDVVDADVVAVVCEAEGD